MGKSLHCLTLNPITLGPLVKWIYLIETVGLGRNLLLMAWMKVKALKYIETLLGEPVQISQGLGLL